MPMKNTLKQFMEARGLTAYQVIKATQIPRNTIYRLVNDPNVYPTKEVMARILEHYPDASITDLITFVRGNE